MAIATGAVAHRECQILVSSLQLVQVWIVGPEQARRRIEGMIQQAKRSIRIVDHRVADPKMLALLRRMQAGEQV